MRHFLLTHPYVTVTWLVSMLLFVSFKLRRHVIFSAIPALVAAFAIFTFTFGCKYSYPVVKHMIGGYILHAQIEGGGGDGAGGGGDERPACDYGPAGGAPLCESCTPNCSSNCTESEFGCCFMWLGPCRNVRN